MQLLLRPPFSSRDTREPAAAWPVTIFVMLVSGFVTWELFTEWRAGEAAFLAAPRWLAAQLAATPVLGGALNWMWALLLVPTVVWLGLAGFVRALGVRERLGVLLRQLALPMTVIVAAGHMSKALAKFASWTPFLPGTLNDPSGVATAQAITAKTIASPAPLLSNSIVSVVGLALVATALIFSIREQRLAHGGSAPRMRSAVPLVVVAAGFMSIIAGWS
jgi:hypothetical protein